MWNRWIVPAESWLRVAVPTTTVRQSRETSAVESDLERHGVAGQQAMKERSAGFFATLEPNSGGIK